MLKFLIGVFLLSFRITAISTTHSFSYSSPREILSTVYPLGYVFVTEIERSKKPLKNRNGNIC